MVISHDKKRYIKSKNAFLSRKEYFCFIPNHLLNQCVVFCKGLGSGRVKIAKFQSRKIIDVLSVLTCLNFDLRSFRNLLNFDAVSILKHVVRPQSDLG